MAAKTNKDFDYRFKVIVVGECGVGKTSLLQRFVRNKFEGHFATTICTSFEIKTIKLDNQTIKLETWDTAGQERFGGLPPGYYRGAQGIIYAFDSSNQESFERLRFRIEESKKYIGEKTRSILVGNKCDLVDKKQLNYETAKEFADELGINFLETSAKENINVEETFVTLAALMKADGQ